jgi:hypothetical protein
LSFSAENMTYATQVDLKNFLKSQLGEAIAEYKKTSALTSSSAFFKPSSNVTNKMAIDNVEAICNIRNSQ